MSGNAAAMGGSAVTWGGSASHLRLHRQWQGEPEQQKMGKMHCFHRCCYHLVKWPALFHSMAKDDCEMGAVRSDELVSISSFIISYNVTIQWAYRFINKFIPGR